MREFSITEESQNHLNNAELKLITEAATDGRLQGQGAIHSPPSLKVAMAEPG